MEGSRDQIFLVPGTPRTWTAWYGASRAPWIATAQFGPYPYRHLTVVERPPNGTGMHADASMITHGEDFPSESRDKPRSLDLPFAVVAHEMGHQWGSLCVRRRGTGHGREPRLVLLDDVRENPRIAQLRRLLSFMRQPYVYPPIRRGQPLLRGLDPYLSYRKEPFRCTR